MYECHQTETKLFPGFVRTYKREKGDRVKQGKKGEGVQEGERGAGVGGSQHIYSGKQFQLA